MNFDEPFRSRYWCQEPPRKDDDRDEYQRDRARIIHSAAFRRLQAKTQAMGVGEGDHHRTRLTHSIETAQIGVGILERLVRRYGDDAPLGQWLPSRDLVEAACFAHDLGHPPFGHGGERALQSLMFEDGGFEANGQTLRILTRLEKYHKFHGINPTRRLILAVLKYPVPYSHFNASEHQLKPPKCFLDSETTIVDWALAPFESGERERLGTEIQEGSPCHRTLDSSIMECADDIAYGIHDLEDIVARGLVNEEEVVQFLENGGFGSRLPLYIDAQTVSVEEFGAKLFSPDSSERKRFIGGLINFFITSAEVVSRDGFQHPLLANRVEVPGDSGSLLGILANMTYRLVIKHAEIQQLEFRGRRVIVQMFDALISDPSQLIPRDAWSSFCESDAERRRVCDYIAGMTDPYAERIYRRLFVPGFGSSRDEL